jgi:flagellar motor switch/type III secretory pathway protein FliN
MGASAFAPPGGSRALCWRDTQQLDLLRAGLQATLDPWARAWGLAAGSASLDNAWQAASPASVTWQPAAAGQDGETVAWLGYLDGFHLAFHGLMFGNSSGISAAEPGAPTLSQALASDALTALRQSVATWLGATEPAIAGSFEGPPPTDTRPWSGAVRATVGLGPATGAVPIWFHFGAKAWPRPDTRGTRVPSVSTALHSLADALAEQPIQLQARLSDVHVSLGELIGLREGDVLVSSHRLADPLTVTLPHGDSPALFGGCLVQRQGRMAVALTQAR